MEKKKKKLLLTKQAASNLAFFSGLHHLYEGFVNVAVACTSNTKTEKPNRKREKPFVDALHASLVSHKIITDKRVIECGEYYSWERYVKRRKQCGIIKKCPICKEGDRLVKEGINRNGNPYIKYSCSNWNFGCDYLAWG